MELKIEHLSKRFKDKTAVDDVSLTLTSGVWGLLGANGAGKTTLMRMIADIMVPTNGAIYYGNPFVHYQPCFWDRVFENIFPNAIFHHKSSQYQFGAITSDFGIGRAFICIGKY